MNVSLPSRDAWKVNSTRPLRLSRLDELSRWCGFKLEPKSDGSGFSKKPCVNAYHYEAGPEHGASIKEALRWLDRCDAESLNQRNKGGGIGFLLGKEGMITPSHYICGIDLDTVLDEEGGEILHDADHAKQICELLSDTYAEVSPSGKGLHFLFLRDIPAPFKMLNPTRGTGQEIKLACEGLYLTFTGNRFGEHPPELAVLDADRWRKLKAIVEEYAPRTEARGSGSKAAPEDVVLDGDGQDITHDLLTARAKSFRKATRDKVKRLVEAGEYEPSGKATDRSGSGLAISMCGFLANLGFERSQIETAIEASWQPSEIQRWAQDQGNDLHRQIRNMFEDTPSGMEPLEARIEAARQGIAKRQDDAPECPKKSEQDYAFAFRDKFGDDYLYAIQNGWFWWDGNRYAREEGRAAFGKMLSLIRSDAATFEGKNAENHRVYVERASFAEGAMKAVGPSYERNVDTFDQHHMLLACPGGKTLDLNTGEIRTSNKSDLITKLSHCTPASPDTPEAKTPRWTQFLNEVTGNDPDFIDYLQRLTGYILTGETREQKLFFLYGPGGNGKGRFVGVLEKLLGDYATAAPMSAFIKKHNEDHPTSIAGMRGARLVVASESDEGKSWDEARIKQLTGQDVLKARFMRQDEFTFRPQFKLLFQGNNQPRIRNMDDGIRRRFHMIPFECRPQVEDNRLDVKLEAELPGIMLWALEGCRKWQDRGIAMCRKVEDATGGYLAENDDLANWLEDCCETSEQARGKVFDSAANLFACHRHWAKHHEIFPKSTTALGRFLTSKGFENVSGLDADGYTSKCRGRIGVRVAREYWQRMQNDGTGMPDRINDGRYAY